ncbi:MAG: phosphoribosyltransferase family protein [Candidatus Nezhaarchaeota archaeon]|nr:phosphoribosyltransferase family protein [Candidatus Nezhaarchaeota archaeon]
MLLGLLVEDPSLRNRLWVFEDRGEAGAKLAERLRELVGREAIVLAVPAGGVPVAIEVSRRLGLELDVAVVRKILYPWTTEAGFGAVAWDGRVLINRGAVEAAGLTKEEVEAKLREAVESVEDRLRRLRGGSRELRLKGREVVLIDDGLATGYTMLAAVEAAKAAGAARIVVAVPTASTSAIDLLLPSVDLLVALNVRGGPFYAVADAYVEWRDLGDEEVLRMLREPLRRPGLREA